MRTLDFSTVPRGRLVNVQGRIGRRLVRRITDALLEEGRVLVLDPNEAVHSRIKHLSWEVYDEVFSRLLESFPSAEKLRRAMGIHRVALSYDLTVELPKGQFVLNHPTWADIRTALGLVDP